MVEVGPNYSNVTLLTDGSSTVIGQLVSNAATGEVVGDLAGALNMTKIDSAVPVQIGDEVVTAGIELAGGIRSPYPKGLLIGQVIDVRRDANDVVQTAFLEPAAGLDRLEYLLVITDYQGGLPEPDSSRSTATPRARTARCPRASSRASRAVTDRLPRRAAGRLRPDEGIVLAGGTATRLYPLTIVTNKHLLPIYDRPMIYYPIETLASMGIREVLVVVGGKSVGDVVELLGDGSHFGLDLTYRYQGGALGIAHAIGLARGFVATTSSAASSATTSCAARRWPTSPTGSSRGRGARARSCTGCPIRSASVSPSWTPTAGGGRLRGEANGAEVRPDPDRRLLPAPDAFDVIDRLAPSGRGEFEITDVLNHYIPEGRLYAPLYEGHWTDAGTVSLLRAAELAAEDHANGKLVAPRERPIG